MFFPRYAVAAALCAATSTAFMVDPRNARSSGLNSIGSNTVVSGALGMTATISEPTVSIAVLKSQFHFVMVTLNIIIISCRYHSILKGRNCT